jgi:DNA-binding XRE family transcriptional regulator
MPKRTLRRIADVAPGEAPLTLRVGWQDGGHSIVDVSDIVRSFRLYAPLRDNSVPFGSVRVGEFGTDVIWTDGIDMAADTLWRLAREQSGTTMTGEAFRRWRQEHAYTIEAAAEALGLSRRMVIYYEQGERPIPRVVALATRALAQAERG